MAGYRDIANKSWKQIGVATRTELAPSYELRQMATSSPGHRTGSNRRDCDPTSRWLGGKPNTRVPPAAKYRGCGEGSVGQVSARERRKGVSRTLRISPKNHAKFPKSQSKVSLWELFGIIICALFGIIGLAILTDLDP
jgi:hypothetical protein